ncbi:MAG: TetR/AcrR family transcriptional regulator [Actinomycetia bacterium]|nr:TetR/AcrR family transcriptional regulator [Actinomycetes bacterium]
MADVKRPNKRTERAQQTRRRIVQAAHDLFVEQGYGATLMPEIANRAGVAVQTIYFTFGTKRDLLKEVVDVAIAGDAEPVATMDRPWFRDALAADTAEEMLRAHVRGTCRVLERVAPILQVLDAAAAADSEIAEVWSHDADPRHTVQTAAAQALVGKPGARPGLTVEHAADILFALLSPELYRLLVCGRRWSSQAHEHWAHDTLRAQLCGDLVEHELPSPTR